MPSLLLVGYESRLRAALEPAFREALGKVYAGTAFTLEQFGTPRELFSVRLKAKGAPGVADLLSRIS